MTPNQWRPTGLVEDDDKPLGMLAKWGTEEDNQIRDGGSRIQSPTIDLNTKLNFEKRVLKPNEYPAIPNDDGSVSTHRMAYGETDGRYVAYPTIVQPKKANELVELGDRDAFEYAMKSGEYRSFKTEDEAKAYAEGGYKKFWGLGEKK
ncbi:hypothetical protein HWB52_gp26 [Pseudomonas phage Littlefix]|uniref:Uncharacterized protein n=1 Tax=Pseudomonas phage Littlefix TaxID=2079289 RepID=A0A2K9VHL0_9CAUD|nr:hypothetical protein HWB52_gp26 [Pseudomonas phage Littlefix]AUV61841.1 hypothetical protein PsPhLittlefix_gp26 [Pseudomonas phage Littlefix]